MGELTCCICGGDYVIIFCGDCQHSFCRWCRWNLFWRGLEAVKQHLTDNPPKHCRCKE